MKRHLLIAAAAASLMAIPAAAQQKNEKTDADDSRLAKEITVDRSIVPQLRPATRMSVSPAVSLPPTTAGKLDYSSRTVTTRVPSLFTPLGAAPYADTAEPSPWRGYASLAYGPLLDIMANAGYRLADTDRTRIGVWGQFDMSFFHHKFYGQEPGDPLNPITEANSLWRRQTASIGADLTQAIGSKSTIGASIVYTYDNYTAPHPYMTRAAEKGEPDVIALATPRVGINRLDADLSFASRVNDLRYSFGADYSLFDFGKTSNVVYWADPVKEHTFGFNAGLHTDPAERSQGIVDLRLAGVNTSATADYEDPVPDVKRGSYTHALLTLTPRYRFQSDRFQADLGVRADLTIHCGKAFHIAPDVKAGWTPSRQFTVWAKAGGGEVQNTLGSLYSFTHMIAPWMVYRNSHIPITVDGGFTLGPWRSAYIRAFGGWAKANEWLMPEHDNFGILFRPVDISGWHAGVALGYSYRRIADIELSAEFAPSSETKGYYLWRDRAKRVIGASLTVRPIDRLEVTADWRLRSGRSIMEYVEPPVVIQSRATTGSLAGILNHATNGFDHNLSQLSIGASYSVTSQLSLMLDLQNILNRKDIIELGQPGRGFHGMIGASLKF